MKIFIVIFTLCVASVLAKELTDDQRKMLKPLKEECLAETGIEDAVIEEAKKKGGVEYDNKVHCFSSCMFKKLGAMTEEGKFDEDVVRALLSTNVPEDSLNAAIGNCKNEVGKNDCETAGKLVNCFLKYKAAMTS